MVTPMRNPDLVYKIATPAAWSEAQGGAFLGMPIDVSDGYIHLSTAAQLSETLRLHFAGQRDLLLIAVNARDLGANLRWEPSRGGALFPHLYGPLPLAALAWIAPLAVAEDGTCALPEAVR